MQCWELMLKALTDHSQLVVSTTYSVLLPALAAWSFELNTLESDILSYFLHQLLTCIKVRPPLWLHHSHSLSAGPMSHSQTLLGSGLSLIGSGVQAESDMCCASCVPFL